MSLLSETQIREFDRDGFLAGIPIMEPAAADRLRNSFNEIEAKVGTEACQTSLLDPHFEQRFAWELVKNGAVLDCIESLLGPNLLLMGAHFFCKYGPSDAFVGWHQDVKYWSLEPPLAVSAWFAVDDSDADNGCMRVIPGSHKRGLVEHGTADKAGNLLSINQAIPLARADQKAAVDIELRAGQISLHHGMILHGSPPNRSNRRRCGLSMAYIPTHCRQVGGNSLGEQWRTVLVRGENAERHFSPQLPPFEPAATNH